MSFVLAGRMARETFDGLDLPEELDYSLRHTVTELGRAAAGKVQDRAMESLFVTIPKGWDAAHSVTKAWEDCYGIVKDYSEGGADASRRLDVERAIGNSDFFLCSEHSDCAEDHLAYQGKVYLGTYPSDDATEIAQIYGIRTLWEVVYLKPYLLTRPYCRHYCIPVPVEDVLGMTATQLVRKYRVFEKEGRRDDMQTKRLYDAQEAVEYYTARLSLHRAMARKTGDVRTNAMAFKDSVLLRSWKRRLEKLV